MAGTTVLGGAGGGRPRASSPFGAAGRLRQPRGTAVTAVPGHLGELLCCSSPLQQPTIPKGIAGLGWRRPD
ncbi:hypothetical protein M5689_011032 [Euphorbia peplus]|nr:hypothetical protein M5689_011032 [Euphorbia peplus]